MKFLFCSALIAIPAIVLASEDPLAQQEADLANPDAPAQKVTTTAAASALDTPAPVPESRSHRIKERAKQIYGRVKANAINRATYYLVDYAFSLKAIGTLGAVKKQQNTTVVEPDVNQPNANIPVAPDAALKIKQAIHAFLLPLKTFQHAQKIEDPEKLSSSLLAVMNILIKKTKEEGAGEDDAVIGDDDYQPGQIWTTVLRKEHVEQVIKQREALLLTLTDEAGKRDQMERLVKIRDYFAAVGSEKFANLISPKLNWQAFETRYGEVVEQVLLRKPDLFRKCRVYLARYLQSGQSNESYWQSLKAEAQQGQPLIGAGNKVTSSTLLYAILVSLVIYLTM